MNAEISLICVGLAASLPGKPIPMNIRDVMVFEWPEPVTTS